MTAGTALAPTVNGTTPGQGAALGIWDEFGYGRRQWELIKRTVARDLSDDEFLVLAYRARETGLSVLHRQIYGIKRGGELTIQTGIDGYRAIAARTGEYAGSDDAVFKGRTTAGDKGEYGVPEQATVTVYRFVRGQRCAFTATARWSEYYPGPRQGVMWHRMPHNQLAKCAESLALRKGFPAELGGIYTSDELDQADGFDREVDTATGEIIETSAASPATPPRPPAGLGRQAAKPPSRRVQAAASKPAAPQGTPAPADQYAKYQKWVAWGAERGIDHTPLPRTATVAELHDAIQSIKSGGTNALPSGPGTNAAAARMRANAQEFEALAAQDEPAEDAEWSQAGDAADELAERPVLWRDEDTGETTDEGNTR